MRRMFALVLCIALMVCAVPAMANAEVFTASTPVYIASEAQLSNIRNAADALNGWYIPDGGFFSFNDAIGPTIEMAGYVTAKNGRGSQVVGGGVAQTATTMYLALLQIPGIQYHQITTYGARFNAGYVDDGALAVVTDYDAAVDFTFSNFSGSDIIMRMWDDGVFLYCELSPAGAVYSGADEDYGTVLSSASIELANSAGMLTNIARAAENAACTVLEPGMEFSFNGIIGPRTEEFGFVSALNGRGVNVIGGGVAQVASVLWLAVRDMDGITVTEKFTYGERYNQDYVDSPEDAIATDYNAGMDFAFRNDGAFPVTVCVYVAENVLCCDIYGGMVEPVETTAPSQIIMQFGGGLDWN